MQHDDWNALWFPDRSVVKADLRKRLPGVEVEVARNPITFLGRGVVRGVCSK